MINDVVLIGRLTKDIEVKSTQSGISVAQFILAVDRSFKNQNGEREADFINCVIWRKGAENLASYTKKGSLIGIQGRLQTRSYDDKDGKRVFVTEVIIDHFSLLSSKSQNQNTSANSQNNNAAPKHDSIPNAENVAGAANQAPQASQSTQPAQNQPIQQQSQPTQPAPAPQTSQPSQAPAQDNSAQDNGAIEDLFNSSDPLNISDDDLPF